MPPVSSSGAGSSAPRKGGITWRPTKIMNMTDLSKDDDFLSHLLVEKLGTGAVPLLVHKMDARARLPKIPAKDLLDIVRRRVVAKIPVQHATRHAVDDLLTLPPVRYWLNSYDQKQINAFATHASRYFELYHPSGSIEIAHTSRYSHRTGKSELCILATRPLAVGTVITELKGSMAHLTKEEDRELKRTGLRNSDIRRDFSVIHSKQMKKNHLFLGPARFVNHDCENNCELFREGKYITFRVIKPIAIGEEITAHYGDGYFGRKNRHCLCETCEKLGRGGYAPEHSDAEVQSCSDSDSDSDTSTSDAPSDGEEADKLILNVNERRTRRGVYAIVQEQEDESDESEDEDLTKPLADIAPAPRDGEIEMEEVQTVSTLSPLPPSRSSSNPSDTTRVVPALGLPTPEDSDPSPSSSLSPLSAPEREESIQSKSTTRPAPFKSIISTRGQKAFEEQISKAKSDVAPLTPPLSEDSSFADLHRATQKMSKAISALMKIKQEKDSRLPTPIQDKGKGKEKEKSRDEPEARVLRVRPPAPTAADLGAAPASRPEIPRGPDGKPLPTCVTCQNVLPLISVDSEVVWGLGFENPSPNKRGRKKKEKHECPRCMRHFAIYEQPWPARVPGQGTAFALTPREEGTPADASSKRVTQKALPALDRKLAAVSTKGRRRHSTPDERPAKRIKMEPGVEMSASARRPVYKQSGYSASAQDNGEQPVKRKRGRPRLSSPRRNQSQSDKTSRPKSLAVQFQPRDSNGRFGRKAEDGEIYIKQEDDLIPDQPIRRPRGRPRTVHLRQVEISGDEGDRTVSVSSVSSRRIQKRKSNSDDESIGAVRTIASQHRSWGGSIRAYEGGIQDIHLSKKPRFGSGARVRLPPGGFKKYNSLFPSPNHFAARHSTLSDTSTSLDEGRSGGVEIEGEGKRVPSRGASVATALTLKPSPLTFARRRWVSSSKSPAEESFSHHHGEESSPEPQKFPDVEVGPAPRDISNIPRSRVNPLEVSYGRWPPTGLDLELSSSGEEDVILPESPDPTKFVLQRRASFGYSPETVADATDDSEKAIERLVAVPTPPDIESSHNPPLLGDPKQLRKSTPFSDAPASPTRFVNAGWDNWSDFSIDV